MPQGPDSKKSNAKADASNSYHRLSAEPTKPSPQVYNPKNPLAPLEDDYKPVKLVSKDKAKDKPEKQSIDDIESFLLEDNDMWEWLIRIISK